MLIPSNDIHKNHYIKIYNFDSHDTWDIILRCPSSKYTILFNKHTGGIYLENRDLAKKIIQLDEFDLYHLNEMLLFI